MASDLPRISYAHRKVPVIEARQPHLCGTGEVGDTVAHEIALCVTITSDGEDFTVSLPLKTRAEADRLIARIARARDMVWPAEGGNSGQ